jgi:hypothetical protein
VKLEERAQKFCEGRSKVAWGPTNPGRRGDFGLSSRSEAAVGPHPRRSLWVGGVLQLARSFVVRNPPDRA